MDAFMDTEVDLAVMDGLNHYEFGEANFEPEPFFAYDNELANTTNNEFDAFEDTWLQSFLDNSLQESADGVEVGKALFNLDDLGSDGTTPDPSHNPYDILYILREATLWGGGDANENGPGGANYEIIVTGTIAGDDVRISISWEAGWGPNDTGPFEALGDAFMNPLPTLGWLFDQIGNWITENELWGCFAPIHITNDC